MFAPAPRRASALAFAAGLGAIIGAWGFQLIGGFIPCELCLQERIPYYVGLPLLLVGLIAAVKLPPLSRILYVAAALVFFYGAALAIYHAGAEWGFWLGPNDCGNKAEVVTDAGNLLAAMNKTRLISCELALIRIFGLSFAGWNVLASGFIALMSMRAAFASHKSLI